ncbi:glycosyltransferase, partial [Arthrobacter sp. SO3]|uniref:glycosyltransferase n=1 Tax=Arthrobacter sp. SO3 TaxID=1897057 RepID=UPI001CFFD2EE
MHNRSDAPTRLPAGKHFAVTWSVPVVHGGRTNSMLHRSRAFAAQGGAPVQVLTFDNFRDYQDIRKTLTEQGKLTDGVTIRNIWEDLTHLAGDAPVLPAADLTGFSPLGETGIPVTTVEGGPSGRTQRFAADGTTLLQTDYLREDGTLFLSDRSDVENPGQHGGRSLTLCNAEGLPVEQWRSSWEMYRAWLDHLTDGEDSYFIVDNKHAATFMKTYRRPSATVFLMVHDSHLATAIHGPASQLSGSGEVVIPRFDSFDGVAILTHMQAEDIRSRIADIGNIHVIPNSRSAPLQPVEAERNPAAGVLLAQLRPLKQIDHAIRAITDVNHRHQTNATLAIYGEGDEAAKLAGLIDHLGVSSLVQLKGHTHSPDKEFGEASFSLLTSSSESFGLVILESMSAGCVPIAYDIHYGPSSIITHGVNGYIVEYGNEVALADCVAEFLALPEEKKSAMREAAIARAVDFSDAPVVSMWSEALAAAAARKAVPAPELHVAVTDTAWGTWSDGALDLRVTARLTAESDSLDAETPRFFCRLRTRGGETFFRAAGETTRITGGGVYTSVFRFAPDIMQALSDSIVDAGLETRLLGRRVTSRLPYSAPSATPMDVYTTVHGNLSLRPAKAPV